MFVDAMSSNEYSMTNSRASITSSTVA